MIKHKFAVIIDIALKVQHVLIQFKVTNVLIQFKVTNAWAHEVDFKSRPIPTYNVNHDSEFILNQWYSSNLFC